MWKVKSFKAEKNEVVVTYFDKVDNYVYARFHVNGFLNHPDPVQATYDAAQNLFETLTKEPTK